MSKNISISELVDLSVAERIELVQDLWDSIAAVPDEVKLTEAQKQELDRRLQEYHKNPAAGSAWEEVKASIRGPT